MNDLSEIHPPVSRQTNAVAKQGYVNFVHGTPKQKSIANGTEEYDQTDPAILIGLAMAFGKNSGIACVPDLILEPLVASARGDCRASQMILAWLERRSNSAGSTLKPISVRAFENTAKPNVCSISGGHHG